jgi:site-specific DNA recombinase
MNIAIYSRKSKYSEKGESIENQIQFCKDYAEIHFKDMEKMFFIYTDEGFSAATTKRPEFQKLVDTIKTGEIQILMCYRLDRINRNVSDFSKTLDLLEKYAVSFISATENFDTTTPMGKAMIYIASVFAQLERETTAERVRDNMLALSRTGRWLGGNTPLGYKSEACYFIDEDYKERQLYKLVPNGKDLEFVWYLFQKYLEAKSLSKLETYCLENHIETLNHCEYTKSSIAAILENPTYCIADMDAYEYFNSLGCVIANEKREFNGEYGVLCYNRTKHQTGKRQIKRPENEWIIAIGKHKGIISGLKFSLVQNQIKNNKMNAAPRNGTSEIALLSGNITCKSCGSKMRIKSVKRKNNKISFYYACEKKVLSKGTRCQVDNIRGIDFDTAILNIITKLLSKDNNKKNYLFYLSQKQSLIMEPDIQKLKTKNKLQKDLNNNELSIHNLIKQLGQATSPILVNYISTQLTELDVNQKKITEELNKLNEQMDSTIDKSELMDRYDNVFDIKYLITNSDITTLKYITKFLIKSITWDGNTAILSLKTSKD